MNAKDMAHWLYRDGANCEQHLQASEMLADHDALARALAKEIKDNPSFYLPAKLEHLLMKAQGEAK